MLGNITADAQLRATKGKAKAQIALVAHGLIRTNINQGPVTYGEVYAAQPFAQHVVTMTLTGRQLDKRWRRSSATRPRCTRTSAYRSR